MEKEIAAGSSMDPPTTTAPEGASMEEVVRGMRQANGTEDEKSKAMAGEPSASSAAHTQPTHTT